MLFLFLLQLERGEKMYTLVSFEETCILNCLNIRTNPAKLKYISFNISNQFIEEKEIYFYYIFNIDSRVAETCKQLCNSNDIILIENNRNVYNIIKCYILYKEIKNNYNKIISEVNKFFNELNKKFSFYLFFKKITIERKIYKLSITLDNFSKYLEMMQAFIEHCPEDINMHRELPSIEEIGIKKLLLNRNKEDYIKKIRLIRDIFMLLLGVLLDYILKLLLH